MIGCRFAGFASFRSIVRCRITRRSGAFAKSSRRRAPIILERFHADPNLFPIPICNRTRITLRGCDELKKGDGVAFGAALLGGFAGTGVGRFRWRPAGERCGRAVWCQHFVH